MNNLRAMNVQKVIREAQAQAESSIPHAKTEIISFHQFTQYLSEIQIRAYGALTISQLTALVYSVVQLTKKFDKELIPHTADGYEALQKLKFLVEYTKKKQRVLKSGGPTTDRNAALQTTEFGIRMANQSLLLLLEWTYYNMTNLHPTISQIKFLATATNLNDHQLEIWFENMRLAIQLYNNPINEIKTKIYRIDPTVCLQPYQNEKQVLNEIKN
ncbi:hypothetical protein HDV01_003080 [Terramyces sp. JEL0728]|nr:hypothetical protein HDV01_003080 [Terramyces sp. JEL0728]